MSIHSSFNRLPSELCEEIIEYCPTSSFFNVSKRLSKIAFATIAKHYQITPIIHPFLPDNSLCLTHKDIVRKTVIAVKQSLPLLAATLLKKTPLHLEPALRCLKQEKDRSLIALYEGICEAVQFTYSPPSFASILPTFKQAELIRDWLRTHPSVLSRIYHLDLVSCNLTLLPLEITLLKNLHFLDLSDNCLTFLPPEIEDFQNLISINLKNNHLTDLPDALLNIPTLESLTISGNRFASRPSVIEQLRHRGLTIAEDLNYCCTVL